MMRIVGVIPARMGSSRFPGKPLAEIGGRTMIEHVYRRTAGCTLLDEVLIATCDVEIASAARGFGARVMMTSDRHERATDRVFEAMRNDPAEIVVMVQGDEPMIKPTMVEAAVRPLLDEPRTQCVNLTACIDTEEELRDPNTIKVVLSRGGDALYFSRSAIPFLPAGGFRSGAWHKQVCVIAFRRRALREFAALSPTPLEQAESIDMLRFLEHGIPVRMVATVETTHAVDTPDDLLRVSALMTADPWPPLGTTRETP